MQKWFDVKDEYNNVFLVVFRVADSRNTMSRTRSNGLIETKEFVDIYIAYLRTQLICYDIDEVETERKRKNEQEKKLKTEQEIENENENLAIARKFKMGVFLFCNIEHNQDQSISEKEIDLFLSTLGYKHYTKKFFKMLVGIQRELEMENGTRKIYNEEDTIKVKQEKMSLEMLKIYKSKVYHVLNISELALLNLKIHREHTNSLIFGINKDMIKNFIDNKSTRTNNGKIEHILKYMSQMSELYFINQHAFLTAFFEIIKGNNISEVRGRKHGKGLNESKRTLKESMKEQQEIDEQLLIEYKCIEDFRKAITEIHSDENKLISIYNHFLTDILEVKQKTIESYIADKINDYSFLKLFSDQFKNDITNDVITLHDEKEIEDIDIFTFVKWFGDDEE